MHIARDFRRYKYICVNRKDYFHKFHGFMEPPDFLKNLQEYGFSCNPCHNILAIYCLSVQVWFVISIRKLISRTTDFGSTYELPNDLKLRILGNHKTLEKSQNWVGIRSSVQSPLKK